MKNQRDNSTLKGTDVELISHILTMNVLNGGYSRNAKLNKLNFYWNRFSILIYIFVETANAN